MKKILNSLLYIILAIFAEMSLASCSGSNSDDIEPVPTPAPTPTPTPNPEPTQTYSIIGEWLEDLGGDGRVNFGVYRYKEDGTTDNYEVSAEKDADNCYIFDYKGKYTLEGKNFIQWQTHPALGNIMYETELKSLTKYDLTFYYDEFKIMAYQHRIIDTYNMQIDESKSISISDNDFVPQSYYSNHERVATVNNKGVITANEAGTAYIIVSSSIGKAVIRVVVTDKDNLFCDFSKYLGGNIDEIVKRYGNEYSDVKTTEDSNPNSTPATSKHYNLYDDFILHVNFFYDEKSREVKVVSPTLRPGIDLNEVKEYLSKKFEFLAEKKSSVTGTIAYDFGKGIILMKEVNGKVVFEEKNIIVTYYPSERTLAYGIYDVIDEEEEVVKNQQEDEKSLLDGRVLEYYEFYALLHKSHKTANELLGDNYSWDTIIGYIMQYPKDSQKDFNGYEKKYKRITFSGRYWKNRPTGLGGSGSTQYIGPIDKIELVLLDNVDTNSISKKLKEKFVYLETSLGGVEEYKINNETDIRRIQFWVKWNPSNRIITYNYNIFFNALNFLQ